MLMEFKRIMPTFFPDGWAASYDVGTAVTQMVINFNNFCFSVFFLFFFFSDSNQNEVVALPGYSSLFDFIFWCMWKRTGKKMHKILCDPVGQETRRGLSLYALKGNVIDE